MTPEEEIKELQAYIKKVLCGCRFCPVTFIRRLCRYAKNRKSTGMSPLSR